MTLQNCNAIPLWSFVIPFSSTSLAPFLAHRGKGWRSLGWLEIVRFRTSFHCILTSTIAGLVVHGCMRLETGLTIRILRYLSNIYEDIPN